jgi:hypothetical protein
MKRLWGKIRGKVADPRWGMAVGVGLISVGFDITWTHLMARLDTLEDRGWVPVDDVATVGDLEQLRQCFAGSVPKRPDHLEAGVDEPRSSEEGA